MKRHYFLIIAEKLQKVKNKRFGIMNSGFGAVRAGFTIVELAVVVVVIAILAGVIVVGYNGATRNTHETAVKSDLQQAVAKLSSYLMTNEQYPNTYSGDVALESDKTTFTYRKYGPSNYCIEGVSVKYDGMKFYSMEKGDIKEGSCPLMIATTMQELTPTQCANLPIFTGSNEEAVITLQDPRGNSEAEYRNYQVAKLADSNCWMLTNLRLGSMTGTLTLTPSDSNVATNFTLPQVTIPGSTSHDNPQVIGPVDNDTGEGATNYGYLYNWPATTAGETTATMPAGSGNASHSICPANWRLPTGDTTGEFAWLNAKMNNPSASAPSTSSGTGFYENWQYTGPFKGVFSGYWSDSFYQHGPNGNFWSSSVHASGVSSAHRATIGSNGIDSYYFSARSSGLEVRCLLN